MGKGGRQVVPAPALAGPSSRPGSAVSRPGSATASRPGTKDLRHRAAARRAKDPTSDKERLRAKFIEQVKSYIGVPYAERYHKEGDALHGQPLYLDCCGLFRQVLRDMREDFGFDVGPWNQCYLYATLPTKLSFKDVKPGDLLFVQGRYTRGRERRQKGDIVHVEMYLGEDLGSGPESTLASRDHWGCVSVQDSFKYLSPWYEITALHWRSLDDWLEGRCDPVAMPGCFRSHDPYGEKVLDQPFRSHTSFFRDPEAWRWLAQVGLFRAACRASAQRRPLRVWSCGCSSGEELYSLALLYRHRIVPVLGAKAPRLECVGSDVRQDLLDKAADVGERRWTQAAIRTVPPDILRKAFRATASATTRAYQLRDSTLASSFAFRIEDTACDAPDDEPDIFDLVLCRYAAFLYCDAPGALRAADRISARLAPGGGGLLGATDPMPRDCSLEPVPNSTNAWTLDADADAALATGRLAQPTLDAYKAARRRRPAKPRRSASEPPRRPVAREDSIVRRRRAASVAARRRAASAAQKRAAQPPAAPRESKLIWRPSTRGAPARPPPPPPPRRRTSSRPSKPFLSRLADQAAQHQEKLKQLRAKTRKEWKEAGRPCKPKRRKRRKKKGAAKVAPL